MTRLQIVPKNTFRNREKFLHINNKGQVDNPEHDETDDSKFKGYDLETKDTLIIPELNLDDQIEKNQDCEFEVRFWTTETSEYRGNVNQEALKKMTSSELLGFDQGIIVELTRVDKDEVDGKVQDTA